MAMKKDENNVTEQSKPSSRYQTMGMSIGMCFGVSIGLAIGYSIYDNGPIGMCFGLSIGMMLGMAIGAAKDKKINGQIKEKAYRITEIRMIDLKQYKVTVYDKSGNIRKIEISDGDMKVEQFEVGDFVYINEAGRPESVMDKETR